MKLKNELTQQVKEILDKYSPVGQFFGEMAMSIVKNAENSEKIIPVIGNQGMGKSTLINSLLKENILPNDADETTCVPVEVSYDDNERAEVEFENGSKTIVVNTREELNAYVDNNENPANNKGVEVIRLYRKSDILRNGVTIVDLPGVGSITNANEKTTKRYLEKISCAVFVIPIVPTIRSQEALFIKSAWAQFSNVVFVENDWGETAAEKKDGTDHNTKILRNIARDIATRFENDIIIVNAYNALQGALTNDNEQITNSNINKLAEKINDITLKWDREHLQNTTVRIISLAEKSLALARKKYAENNESVEEQQRLRREEYEKFEAANDELIEKIDDAREWLDNAEESIRSDIRKEISKAVGSIRVQLFKTIDDGCYGGDDLNEAFSGIQTAEVNILMEISSKNFAVLAENFKEKLEDLNDVIFSQDEVLYSGVNINTDAPFRWEKGVDKAMKIAGGIGGAIFLASNPIGWGVAIAGAAIMGIASLFGFGVKKWKEEQRKAEIKQEIAPSIIEIERKLNENYSKQIYNFFSQAQETLRNLKKSKKEEVRNMRNNLKQPIDNPSSSEISEDIRSLESFLAKIK